MNLAFDGYILFTTGLILLIIAQRTLQKELQVLLLLLTRSHTFSVSLFSILLLPGVIIHELSHLVMATILGLKVKKISLIPEVVNSGQVRLGYVQTEKSDPIRDSLVGLAPFISGIFLVGYIAQSKLDLSLLVDAFLIKNVKYFLVYLKSLPQIQDFSLWVYLAFAISTTMLPSKSDRESWKQTIIFLAFIFLVILVIGLGGWMTENIYPFLNQTLASIGLVLLAGFMIHVIIILPVWIIKMIALKLTGLQVTREP